jgi:proteasome-associated ATPase
MSDHRRGEERSGDRPGGQGAASGGSTDPLLLLDECLAALSPDDPRQRLLYRLRHQLAQAAAGQQQREAELRKLTAVVEKLTTPANRVGTLLDLPAEGLARVVVGGAEYYTNVDPRVESGELKVGAQVLVNEAFAVIKALGYDLSGPVLTVAECLPDGRLRFQQEGGRQSLILPRSTDLASVELRAGDEVRVDPGHRIALERMEERKARTHLLDETPTVTWEQIGGQERAIAAIRRAIEAPLLHRQTFDRYRFAQPKGFLLYGPPGCGKTMIGQAAAASLAKLVTEAGGRGAAADPGPSGRPPIAGGLFLHVKGPEILNMWLGESERLVRDLFTRARERRRAGYLPFIFIDEAESILGTRRAMRSFNITNTLVPMFCAEMDGVESLRDVVIILASNRPDLIDPAVLRPGRIDRKIKVARPGREEAAEILRVYLTPDLPLDRALLDRHGGDRAAVVAALASLVADSLFKRSDANRLLAIRLRNGQSRLLYRGDLVSGAILASIVQRAKERAIEREVGGAAGAGLTADDLLASLEAEYREGEVLPPDEAAEEWLKLLDHHPDQVVGVRSFRAGRAGEERPVGHII